MSLAITAENKFYIQGADIGARWHLQGLAKTGIIVTPLEVVVMAFMWSPRPELGKDSFVLDMCADQTFPSQEDHSAKLHLETLETPTPVRLRQLVLEVAGYATGGTQSPYHD